MSHYLRPNPVNAPSVSLRDLPRNEGDPDFLQAIVELLRKPYQQQCPACRGEGLLALRGICGQCQGRGQVLAR
jgi:DnaJ-class molecular chaperone